MNNVQLKPVQEIASKNSSSFAPFLAFVQTMYILAVLFLMLQ